MKNRRRVLVDLLVSVMLEIEDDNEDDIIETVKLMDADEILRNSDSTTSEIVESSICVLGYVEE
jgi:hypothetical protein